jgi:effector-binding domain-containing protein
MKFIKWSFIALSIVAALLIIAGLFAPKESNIKRSVVINKDKATIYNILSDFHRMVEWSPWAKLDPACTYEYSGKPAEVGHSFNWKGNNDVGTGKMTLTALSPDQELSYTLQFVEPFESNADGKWLLKDTVGATAVTWTFHSQFGFVERIFMLFVDMDNMLGSDFENGLLALKEVAENSKPDMVVQEINFTPAIYIGKRMKLSFAEVDSALFSKTYQELGAAFGKNNAQMTGAPVSIAYGWDLTTQTADLAPAFPVASDKGRWDGFDVIRINDTKALAIDFYGPYNQTEKAHVFMEKYISEKGISVQEYAIEEYLTDPASANYDYSKVLTRIIYFPK